MPRSEYTYSKVGPGANRYGAFHGAEILRDVLSSPLMINNDRILSSLTMAALMTPVPATLTA